MALDAIRIHPVFLASSINEFERERNRISIAINDINDSIIDDGDYLRLVRCEYASQALAPSRKQEQYNESIRHSEIFVLLAGATIGRYTAEELEVALTQREKGGATPRIVVFIKSGCDQNAAAQTGGLNQRQLRDRLAEAGITPCFFSTPDDLSELLGGSEGRRLFI